MEPRLDYQLSEPIDSRHSGAIDPFLSPGQQQAYYRWEWGMFHGEVRPRGLCVP